MFHRREPMRPAAASLALVKRCAEQVAPEDPALAGWYAQYSSKQARRIAHDLELLREVVPDGARVLEFGAVPLLLTAPLVEVGYEVVGLDIGPERFAGAIERLGVEVLRCDVEREVLPFEDASFDAVIFNELFEHLRIDLITTMTEVLRVLKPGGVMLLSTPNLRSFSGIRNFLFRGLAYSCERDIYGQYEKLHKLGHMGHVREYTEREVREFLERIGFQIDGVVYRGRTGGIGRLFTLLISSWMPFISYQARKPVQVAVER